jgi:hypothetical protein
LEPDTARKRSAGFVFHGPVCASACRKRLSYPVPAHAVLDFSARHLPCIREQDPTLFQPCTAQSSFPPDPRDSFLTKITRGNNSNNIFHRRMLLSNSYAIGWPTGNRIPNSGRFRNVVVLGSWTTHRSTGWNLIEHEWSFS